MARSLQAEGSGVDVPALRVLPLEPGDRLTRPEFERRYEAMPHLKKAELIEGVVYVPLRVRHEGHGRQHSALNYWLSVYSTSTPGAEVSDNATVRLDLDNEPQPDLLLRIASGGQSRVDSDGFITGAPELIAEIASSSAAYDLHQELTVYRRHSVREYIVWRVLENAIDWFVLRDGRYEPSYTDEASVVRSEVFPGLWLDAVAMIRSDMATVLKVLGEGLGSTEHETLVVNLQQTR
jgi:Uma2 family endonuclease